MRNTFVFPVDLRFTDGPLVNRLLRSALSLLRSDRARELICWCAPALLLGLTLRVLLCVELPFALVHDDTPDVLSTPDGLLNYGKFSVHEKKTFLYPAFVTAHAVLPFPALRSLPITQHALGLVLVLLVGALVREWFRFWRWGIVPVTVLVAVNPYLLWYEHTVMAETLFVFATVLLAVAGTFYTLRKSRGAFVALCAALVLAASTRPEGKLLFGFGLLLLAAVHWRDWKILGTRLAMLCALALATHLVTRTKQGGLLLYTNVARLTPEKLENAPGFEPYIAPVREGLQQRWEQRRSFPGAEDRRAVVRAVKAYLDDTRRGGSSEAFCQRVAIETCMNNLLQMPGWCLQKLQATGTQAPSGRFNFDWLLNGQKEALTGNFPRVQRLAPRLFGRTFETESDVEGFLETNYPRVRWFNRLHTEWTSAAARLRFAGENTPQIAPHRQLPGVPIYFALAGVAAVALAFRRGPLRPFHLTWGMGFVALFVVIFLAANIHPRFRIAYEPFWIIYVASGADLLAALVLRSRVSSVDRSDPRANR